MTTKFTSIETLMEAKDNGQLPSGFMLIIDNDSVHSIITDSDVDNPVYEGDPWSLLRELLSYVGLDYDEV